MSPDEDPKIPFTLPKEPMIKGNFRPPPEVVPPKNPPPPPPPPIKPSEPKKEN